MAQILIVDDDVDMLTLLAKIITKNTNHNVTTTNNPFEVPKLIKEGAFDLLITDPRMPDTDVAKLFAEVRKIDKSIPILIIVEYGSTGSFDENITKHIYDYITKPYLLVRKEQILITVDRALGLYDRQR